MTRPFVCEVTWPLSRLAILAVLSIFLLVTVPLFFSGIGVLLPIEFGAAIAWQSLSGFALTRYLFQGRPLSTAVLVGVGLPLGILLSMLADQVLRGLFPWNSFWAAPSALALVLVCIFRRKPIVLTLPTIRGATWFLVASSPVWVACLSFWRQWPLAGKPWWSVDGDASTHEALANSLALAGPQKSLSVLGSGIPYHWFADAWAGRLTQQFDVSPFITISRPLFVVTAISVPAALWVLAGTINPRASAKLGGVLFGVGCSYFLLNSPQAGSLVFTPFSPTFQFGLMGLSAFSVVAVSTQRNRFSWRTATLLGLLAISISGGRTSDLFIASGAAGLVVLIAFFHRRDRISAVSALVILLVAGGITYLVLFRVSTLSSSRSSFHFAPNLDLPSMRGLVPFNSPIGFSVAVVVTSLAVMVGGVGNLWLVRWARLRSEGVWWCVGAGASGLIGVYLTQQVGYSHFSLLGAGMVLFFTASGVGVASAAMVLRDKGFLSSSRTLAIISFVAFVGLVVIVVWPHLSGFRFDGLVRSLTPLGVVTVTVLGALLIAPHYVRHKSEVALALIVFSIGMLALISSLLSAGERLATPSSPVDPRTTYALSTADLEAGQWTQENVPPDAVMATNRLCSLPQERPPFCVSTVFPISALGHRQALIEGTSFDISVDLASEGPDYKWAVDRLTGSRDFGASPTYKSADYLWAQGVRYYWVDRSVPNSGAWDPFASPVFSNDRALILKMNDPATWKM